MDVAFSLRADLEFMAPGREFWAEVEAAEMRHAHLLRRFQRPAWWIGLAAALVGVIDVLAIFTLGP